MRNDGAFCFCLSIAFTKYDMIYHHCSNSSSKSTFELVRVLRVLRGILDRKTRRAILRSVCAMTSIWQWTECNISWHSHSLKIFPHIRFNLPKSSISGPKSSHQIWGFCDRQWRGHCLDMLGLISLHQERVSESECAMSVFSRIARCFQFSGSFCWGTAGELQ